MLAYHGTNRISAAEIIGPPTNIDVTMGGGELGRGFYVGESVALAAAFSRGKYNLNGVVLKFDIDDHSFVQLNIRTLNRREQVYQHWRHMLRRRQTNQFLYNVDVVTAPFSTIDFSLQHKFESLASQDTLNNHSVIQLL
jgi:hypothetical protein